MSQIIMGLIIGGFVVGYVLNETFRHYANCVIMFCLKIPLNLFDYIDRGTCGKFYSKPRRNYVAKSEPKIRQHNPTVRQPQVSTFKNAEGKVGLSMDTDNRLKEWLDKNPELKIFEN